MVAKRARNWGICFPGRTGAKNSITDVSGVLVGQTTRISDAGESPVVRTGVTAILPFGHTQQMQMAAAGVFSLNGNGEMTGTHWIRDSGHFAGPICITNTHSVGIVHHAAVRWMVSQHRNCFDTEHLWAMPVVAETFDGVLNDINGQHITEDDALSAISSASACVVKEGNTGGGTGMICYEFKGGTGSSSRIVEIDCKEYTVGVLVQANHGIRDWLTILGEPVGKQLTDGQLFGSEQGSIIVVIATDLPMRPDQLERLARRGAIGIGRSGTPGGNNSGDIFLAFSTANPKSRPGHGGEMQSTVHVSDDCLDAVYLAAIEATDEATINAMFAAQDMMCIKPEGKLCKAIDIAAVVQILTKAGKCEPNQ